MGFVGKSSRPVTPGGLLGQLQADDNVTRTNPHGCSTVSNRQKARPRSAISTNRPSFSGRLHEFVLNELTLVKAIQ